MERVRYGELLLRGRTLVRFHVLLQVVFSTELLLADLTRIRLLSAMDLLVPGELLVAGEAFVAVRMVAGEWSFSCMRSNVVLELAVVREARIALSNGTDELLGPVLFKLLNRVRLLDVRHQNVGGQVVCEAGELAAL